MKHIRMRATSRQFFGMAIPPQERRSYFGEPLLLSQEEVGYKLGISRTSVWRLIKNGELAPVRIGARTLITSRSIDHYLSRGGAANATD